MIIVGANKGGVGKTTISRTLIEYFKIKDIAVAAYDTQSPGGNLRRYHPDLAETIDLEDTRDQCGLLDDLGAFDRVNIVDLRAGALTSTLQLFRDVGVFDAAAEGRLNLSLLHVIGCSHSSVAEIAELAPFRDACNYRVVKSFGANSNLLKKWAPDLRESSVAGGVEREIAMPRLDALAFEAVEVAGVPFSSFVLDDAPVGASRQTSFVLRGYVKTWLERVWDNFEAAGVDDLVSSFGRTAATAQVERRRENKGA
jgi:hypothetical protein